jgi:hypothetical protein
MPQRLIYEQNLNSIKEVNPKLYNKLATLDGNAKYEVFVSQKDPLDINIYDNIKKIPLYKNPVLDTLVKIDEFASKSRYPFLVFFGFGNGVFLQSILQNKVIEDLIVVEPEIEILFIALHFLDYSQDILSQRLRIYHYEDFDYYSMRSLIGEGGFGAYLRLYELHQTLSYYGTYKTELMRANEIFIDAIINYVHAHGNDTTDSLVGIEHFVTNLPKMLGNNTFSSLRAGKNSDVAVMVSTGPSLNKQLPLLKSIQNNVTIICIDASMPILEANGIAPDIVCSMERIVETAKFFEKTSKEFHKGIVFVSSAVQHAKIHENIKGGEICVVMRPFGYMKYFEFHEFGYSGIGLSAANMGLEIAYLMDFKRLIMIGQDLSYGEDGTSHASGHVFGANEKSHEETDSFVLGWGGAKTVRTNLVWRLFLNYFIVDIQDASDRMQVINCTEGGVRIDGTTEMRFADAINDFVDTDVVKQKLVVAKDAAAVYEANILKAKVTIEDYLEYAKDMKKATEELFLEVANECDNLKKLNEQKELNKVEYGKIKKLLGQIDDLKDKCSDGKFQELIWDCVQSFFLSCEMENAVIAVKHVENDDALKAKLVEFLFSHKPFLFLLAGGIDALITVIERSKSGVYEEADRILKS